MASLRSIKSKREFDLLYRKGKTCNGSFFYLKCLPSKKADEVSRFSIVVGLKISKKAVERNRKRRQLREIIRLNLDKIKKGFLVLVIAKEEILEAEYLELEREFLGLIKKAGIAN